jgi:hypothetical protein
MGASKGPQALDLDGGLDGPQASMLGSAAAKPQRFSMNGHRVRDALSSRFWHANVNMTIEGVNLTSQDANR